MKYEVDEKTGCWIWKGAVSNGYGVLYIEGKKVLAHRVSYQMFKGSIAGGRGNLIRHACGNKLCVNPEHLLIGKHIDNIQDEKDYIVGIEGKIASSKKSTTRTRFSFRFESSTVEIIKTVMDAENLTMTETVELLIHYGILQYSDKVS